MNLTKHKNKYKIKFLNKIKSLKNIQKKSKKNFMKVLKNIIKLNSRN